MEALIITKDQFEELLQEMQAIRALIEEGPERKEEELLDNSDFIRLMKVSSRTAQTWRDEGKIALSQIGKKIYYRYSDVELFLEQHYQGAFGKRKV